MANATDARISVALPGHPKTKKLARRLGDAGPLHCIYLFLWTAANRSNGDLSGMTDEDIELAINWTGEPDVFVAAMAAVGFLDGQEGQRRIHDWDDHNAWAAGAGDRSMRSKFAVACREYGRARALKMYPEYAARLAVDNGKMSGKGGADDVGVHSGDENGSTGSSNGSGVDHPVDQSRRCPLPFPSDTDTVSVTDTLPSQEHEPTDVGLSAAGGDAAADDRGTDGGKQSQDLLGKVPRKNGPPPCPHLKIIDLYHEILPELTEVRVWEGDRERKLAARWKSDAERQNLDWWKAFFGSVREMPFLMGERTGRDGRGFTCTLEWLVSPKNFAKVIEGNYLDVRR
ncbi:hypothetical protein [Stenotrophomonas sp. NPDC078853]|uniref:hypothetical protein n=1 Tax=Stenotrophomonas sp. NPDC078853 TaxID=3364534 RepID=UPI00384E8678